MKYDVVVIGSGPGGYVAAIRGAQLGGKIALVEANKLGGTCLNVGCIPTKALVHSATTYLLARRAGEFGIIAENVGLDLKKVMAHKEKTVTTLVSGLEKLLKGNGVDIYRGKASIPSPGKVEVTWEDGTGEMLETRHIIIATGSTHELPPVSPESISYTISSDDALSLNRVPERLLVIGGGVVAVEFACIWNAFGAQVEMVKRSPLILPPVDEEISRRLMMLLKRKGITVSSGLYVKEIREENGEKVLVAEDMDGQKIEKRADIILVAMGRKPAFGGLDLDSLGVAYSKKGIQVDARMATTREGIWAIGDVVGKTYLAPVASFEGIVAMDNIFGHPRTMDYRVVPNCVFSIPECASVGLKESEASAVYPNVKVSRFPFSANGRAMAIGETEGFVKAIADENGKILGMHIMGPHADDLIHEGALAMAAGLSAKDIAEMVHAHPTLPEAVLEACHGVVSRPIHLLTR